MVSLKETQLGYSRYQLSILFNYLRYLCGWQPTNQPTNNQPTINNNQPTTTNNNTGHRQPWKDVARLRFANHWLCSDAIEQLVDAICYPQSAAQRRSPFGWLQPFSCQNYFQPHYHFTQPTAARNRSTSRRLQQLLLECVLLLPNSHQ